MARAIRDSDWDKLYQGESDVLPSPTCDIGEPQPEFAALERDGRFQGEVLDAGCGIGELSLYLAAKGHQVVGVDGCMFHSLPLELREGYLSSVARAARPGASYFLITFSKEAAAPDSGISRGTVGADELAAVVGEYFDVEEVRPAHWVLTHNTYLSEVGFNLVSFPTDAKGRAQIAAWLLVGHKPDERAAFWKSPSGRLRRRCRARRQARACPPVPVVKLTEGAPD